MEYKENELNLGGEVGWGVIARKVEALAPLIHTSMRGKVERVEGGRREGEGWREKGGRGKGGGRKGGGGRVEGGMNMGHQIGRPQV